MSAPDDVSGPVFGAGARPRFNPPRRDKRGASADRVPWEVGGGDCSPALSCSRASLSSNRDSGYVPSPAGAVRFELDAVDADDAVPSAPPPRPATRPITIPSPAGLPPPEESALLRRRLQRRRCSPSPSSSSEVEAEDEDEEDDEDVDEDGEEEAGMDEVDQAEAEGQVALLYREAQSLQVGWREGAVMPRGFTIRAELPDVVPPRPPPTASVAVLGASAPAGRRRPASRASSASLSIELDVGQELREIADSLPLSRSAPGALLPRRDIWALIRRTFDFGLRREMTPRAGGNPGRP